MGAMEMKRMLAMAEVRELGTSWLIKRCRSKLTSYESRGDNRGDHGDDLLNHFNEDSLREHLDLTKIVRQRGVSLDHAYQEKKRKPFFLRELIAERVA